jgi:hypothetical protein
VLPAKTYKADQLEDAAPEGGASQLVYFANGTRRHWWQYCRTALLLVSITVFLIGMHRRGEA